MGRRRTTAIRSGRCARAPKLNRQSGREGRVRHWKGDPALAARSLGGCRLGDVRCRPAPAEHNPWRAPWPSRPAALGATLLLSIACQEGGGGATRGYAPAAPFDTTAAIVHRMALVDGPPLELGTALTIRIPVPQAVDSAAPDRFVHASAMADGGILVTDQVGAQVVALDRAGRLRWRSGERGAEPGQFQGPTWASECSAGQIVVYDYVLQRLTLLDSEGEVQGIFRPMAPPLHDGFRSQPVCNDKGIIAATTNLRPRTASAEGPFRPSVTLATWRTSDGAFERLTDLPGPDYYYWSDVNVSGPLFFFGRTVAYAIGPTAVFVATGDAYDIAAYTLAGEFQTLHVIQGVPRPEVTEAHLASAIDRHLQTVAPAARTGARRILEAMDWPKHHPAVDRLLFDPQGCVWASANADPNAASDVWRIVPIEGGLVSAVALPATFRLTEVRESELLGINQALSGETVIQIYPLERNPGTCS